MFKIGKVQTKYICFGLLIFLIELRFLEYFSPTILGLSIALLITYLYIFLNATLEVSLIIVVANDALGTILAGKISFQYLLLVLLIYTLINNRKFFVISLKELFIDLSVIFASTQLYFVGFVELKAVLFTLLYYYAIKINYRYIDKNEVFIERFTFAMSLICMAIALHACITGGVVYNEYDATQALYIRKGLLGVGIGDPNFSSMLICFGTISTVMNPEFHLLYKIIAVIIFIKALIITVSTTGIIGMVLFFILLALINKKIPKKIRNILIVLFVILILFSIYNSLPSSIKIPAIDMYIERITSKFNALLSGQWNEVTTGRSSLANDYWSYISNEGIIRLLFGFNVLNCAASRVPHNTYIDFILQFGILGSMLYMGITLFKIKKILCEKDHLLYRKVVLIYKIIFLFYLGTLSLYQGNLFALMTMFLLVL